MNHISLHQQEVGTSNNVRIYRCDFGEGHVYDFEISINGNTVVYLNAKIYYNSELLLEDTIATNVELQPITTPIEISGPGTTKYTIGTDFKTAGTPGEEVYINNSKFYFINENCYYECTLVNGGGSQVQTGGTSSVKTYFHDFNDSGNTRYKFEISRNGNTIEYIKIVAIISGGTNIIEGNPQTAATNVTLQDVTETTTISGTPNDFTIGTNFKTGILNGNRIYINDSYFYDIQGEKYVQYEAE